MIAGGGIAVASMLEIRDEMRVGRVYVERVCVDARKVKIKTTSTRRADQDGGWGRSKCSGRW